MEDAVRRDERVVAYVGGSLFIAFAVATAAEIVTTHGATVAAL